MEGRPYILNPFSDDLTTIPGTRILENSWGMSGLEVNDPEESGRRWTIHWLLAPIRGRALGGVRALMGDQKGFVTFCNQRDLEVMLGIGRPGSHCYWLREDYPEPGARNWFGPCCDEEDLRDDLHSRECQLREQYVGHPCLPPGLELIRRVHVDLNNDVEEMLTLLGDADMDTGVYPDPRLETISRRWVRVEKQPVIWRQLLR